MTFEERFEFNNPTIIEIAKNKTSKLTEDASTVGMYIDMATLLKDYEQSETEYLAIRKIYNSIIESPLVLNANGRVKLILKSHILTKHNMSVK